MATAKKAATAKVSPAVKMAAAGVKALTAKPAVKRITRTKVAPSLKVVKPRRNAAQKRATPSFDTAMSNISAAMDGATSARMFKFGLKDIVTITASGEEGQVRARAEYVSGMMCYQLAYTTAAGEYKEAWVDEDLLH